MPLLNKIHFGKHALYGLIFYFSNHIFLSFFKSNTPMDKQETYDILNDLYETYQYLLTKLEYTREFLDGASNPLVPFEKEKVLDVINSIAERHDEIQNDIAQIKELAKS